MCLMGLYRVQEDVMRGLKSTVIISAVLLGCTGFLGAQTERMSPSSVIQLQRDSLYEQNLKYQASVDTAITPARVLRWLRSMGGKTDLGAASSFEFQPILTVNDQQEQIVGQFAYKF